MAIRHHRVYLQLYVWSTCCDFANLWEYRIIIIFIIIIIIIITVNINFKTV